MADRTLDVGIPREILTVADLTRRIKARLESEPTLRGLRVRGEVSNFFRASSGHLYFTLKDASTQVACVMWKSDAASISAALQDGVQVLATGDVTVYDQRGQYQLRVHRLEPIGDGLLWLRLAELKKKLEAEGLFDPAKKRPLPRVPLRIGVVTSRDGAAFHDIRQVLARRAPYVEVVFADARVQGAEAVPMLVAALRRIGRAPVDVVIVGRGGGSLEDLWAFNEEAVVRAIAACPVPIVSAVGHETDVTLADFAADWRAPTPSAAAERVAPAAADLEQMLDTQERRMLQRLGRHLEIARARLLALATRPVLRRPEALLAAARRAVDEVAVRLPRAAALRIENARHAFERAAGVLDALSPLKVLARGYAVAESAGRTVGSVDAVRVGDGLDVRVADGTISTQVRSTRKATP